MYLSVYPTYDVTTIRPIEDLIVFVPCARKEAMPFKPLF